MSLASLRLGGGVAVPSVVATATTLWVQLEGGLVGCALDGSGACDRALPLLPSSRRGAAAGPALFALQWATSSHTVYGLLRNESGADTCSIVSFVDAGGSSTPSLTVIGTPVPVPARAGLAALLSDRCAHARRSGRARGTRTED